MIWDEAQEIICAKGHRPVMSSIESVRKLAIPTFLMSASITPLMVPLLCDNMKISNPILIREPTHRIELGLVVWPVRFWSQF